MDEEEELLFEVGDRVMMAIGRRWHGEVISLADAYPWVKMLTVRWDNGYQQLINTVMMELIHEE